MLAVWLSGCGQIVIVPPTPEAALTAVDITWQQGTRQGTTELGRQGYAFYMDQVQRVTYRTSDDEIEREFGAALSSMREILGAGLPELAHSYVALLGSEQGPLGHLEVAVGEVSPVTLDEAGQGLLIDGYPNLPHGIGQDRLRADFGPALAAQADTLRAMRSYLFLPVPPDGYQDRLRYETDGRVRELDAPGQALTLDGNDYAVDSSIVEGDFSAALAEMTAILAAGLPELPHSYLVLLEHGHGSLGRLAFSNAMYGGSHELYLAGQGVYIDGYPDRPRVLTSERLDADFSAALDALDKAYKAMRSYLILLESPDGAQSKVVYRTHGRELLLDEVGKSVNLDGFDHLVDADLAEADFAPARSSTRQILDEGLPKLRHSYVGLMSHPAGPVGEVEILEGHSQGVILDASGQAVIIDGYSDKVYAFDAVQYEEDFSDALAATPLLPATRVIYFDLGTTRVAKESREMLVNLMQDLRVRAGADVTIAGYADTVGGHQANERLSQRRSQVIADMILASGVPVLEVEQTYFGKTMLAVETPDNTPELLNRRVEVTLR